MTCAPRRLSMQVDQICMHTFWSLCVVRDKKTDQAAQMRKIYMFTSAPGNVQYFSKTKQYPEKKTLFVRKLLYIRCEYSNHQFDQFIYSGCMSTLILKNHTWSRNFIVSLMYLAPQGNLFCYSLMYKSDSWVAVKSYGNSDYVLLRCLNWESKMQPII